jgi:glucosyl-dolichyl phosphate glucuronosyltransferase
MTENRTAAVVVCVASDQREGMLRACVDSLLAGTRLPDELFVVVDQNPALQERLASLPDAVQVMSTPRQGNSEGRNVGIHSATSDVVAFVDDDAAVEPAWLEHLMDAFEADDDLVGAGGAVVPKFLDGRRWLPDELLWVVGCTYAGHRTDAGPIRNPIGCNMAFRLEPSLAVGGFATQFGKRGNVLETCDETEPSLRIERAYGPDRIRFAPRARVRHFVPVERISWRLLLRRSLSEGRSKGRIHRLYRHPALSPERDYVRGLLTERVPRMLVGGIVRRDAQLMAGAGAILLSLLVTGAAFMVGAAAAEARGLSTRFPYRGEEPRPRKAFPSNRI